MGDVHPSHIRNATAVVGPTNTGKTHLAIERMLDHKTGVIGLPLRLLAKEVYDKITARTGVENVALITGDEKIKPINPSYWVCTVEAMPQDLSVQFVAIDEIQLATDPERGHIFTNRLLHSRGNAETLILGAETARKVIKDLLPNAHFISRPRLSKLVYTGQKKITRLPERSAIVAFSAGNVYSIAELIRRQRGGAAVVLGALSPRTRNAQVGLYQSGDVDFLVATDAIGMGLNLDVKHVAFSATCKFDGQNYRNLKPNEIAQIAGRAGRHLSDGTFGVTGDAVALEPCLVEQLETHKFDKIKTLNWRNSELDFSNIHSLRHSLRQQPSKKQLVRTGITDDIEALEILCDNRELMKRVTSRDATEKLWNVCQIPDYRKISTQNHVELISVVYGYLMENSGRIDDDWLSKQVEYSDRIDGDIDTLSNRHAHIRTCKFVANRPDWLHDPEYWQERTSKIEDNLSDALHTSLTKKFVDKRTSALIKGLKDKEKLTAHVSDNGQVLVENHFVGHLIGFCFKPDANADGIHGRAARHAATKVLELEISALAERVMASRASAFILTLQGVVLFEDYAIAKLEAGEDPLRPLVHLIADENLQTQDRQKVQKRIDNWIGDIIRERLKPLVDISRSSDITGLAKGIAFRLVEEFGVLRRETIASEIKSLDQTARAQLRRYGLRFGAFNIFFPLLLKPAAAEMLLTLWLLKFGRDYGFDSKNFPETPRAGLTSVSVNDATPDMFYKACGFHKCGARAVRVDILERLADQIRLLLSWRSTEAQIAPPKGATGAGSFTITSDMMSILGCSVDELKEVLQALGFRYERKQIQRHISSEIWNSLLHARNNPKHVDEFDNKIHIAKTSRRIENDVSSSFDTDSILRPSIMPVEQTDQEISYRFNNTLQSTVLRSQSEPTTHIVNCTNNETERLKKSHPKTEMKMDERSCRKMLNETKSRTVNSEMLRKSCFASNVKLPHVEVDEVYIEVWRPKRRNDLQKRGRRKNQYHGRLDQNLGSDLKKANSTPVHSEYANKSRHPSFAKTTNASCPSSEQDLKNKRKHENRRRVNKGTQLRSYKTHDRSSLHKKKNSYFDPDSPFAALSELRNTLNDQDNKT